MGPLFLSAAAPLMTMATSDYFPYPMHTAQDSAAVRTRKDSLMTPSTQNPIYNGPTSDKRFRPIKMVSTVSPTRPTPPRKPVQRVDSSFDAASETSSITFTNEVKRFQAARLYLHKYHDSGAADEDDEDFVDEGNLGLMHRDSICIIVERSMHWEEKAVRAKRNRKSQFKMAKKWFKRKLVPGSDGRSWYLTL